MVTVSQLCRGARKSYKASKKGKKDALNGAPHRRGVCLKVYQRSPTKPNSGNRWVARVRLSSGRIVVAHIPGEGNTVQEHANLLIRGGRGTDLPGVRHRVVRGALDCRGVKGRITSRSKYGAPKPRG